MRIICDIISGLVMVFLFVLIIFTAASSPLSIGWIIVESTFFLALIIESAASRIVAAINYPRDEAAATRRKQESVQRKTAETLRSNEDREEREMIAEIKLGELMNPKLPEIKKPPRETDFDSIIAGEIAGQTPQRAAPPPRRSRPG